MDFQKANNSYNASLDTDYAAGDATLGVSSVPTNFPTIITVARNTDKETRFYVTSGGSGILTGVTRLDGANENISAGVSVECMFDAEFINQLESAVFEQAGLKGLVYAADGESTDAYAITLTVAPTAYTDIIGLPIAFKANTVNTGAATLNVNGLGAKTIKKNHDQDLADGDIESGQVVMVVYDGTNFQLQSNTETALPTAIGDDGWTTESDTWVYVSAGSFKITGSDVTARFPVGTKIKLTQTTEKYFYVTAAAFSTDTTITVTGGSDYSLANAAITAPYYSYQANPQGHPLWFNYSPSITWDGSAPTTNVTSNFKFSIVGRTVFYRAKKEYSSAGSSNTLVNFDAPVTPAVGQASEYNVPGSGSISTAIGGSAPSNPSNFVMLYGTISPQIYIKANATIAAKSFWAAGFYEI